MFNKELVRPKPLQREKAQPRLQDINFPCIKPGYYQHIAREPNTNYFVQLQEYRWHKGGGEEEKADAEEKRIRKEKILLTSDRVSMNKMHEARVREKIAEKFKAYEEMVEKRRQKLRLLLADEERQYIYETVDQAQRGNESKYDEMSTRAEQLRARRESERLALVHEKRVEQYSKRCENLREARIKHNLVETKLAQLQQIKEKEAKLAAERELDHFWDEINKKEIEEKRIKEEQDFLKQKTNGLSISETWQKQIQGKWIMEDLKYKNKLADRIEIDNLILHLKREQQDDVGIKKQKQVMVAKDLKDQIAQQKMILDKRREQEEAMDKALANLCQMEIDKEKGKISDIAETNKREMKMYRQFLEQLRQAKIEEEKHLNIMLEQHKQQIEAEQNKAFCKLWAAKEKLRKDCVSGRAEQIKYKEEEAEAQLKLKQVENEYLRMCYDTNQRLQEEFERSEAEATKNYRQDLDKQIEYNKILKLREQEELERQLKVGIEEEKKYEQLVNEMSTYQITTAMQHPFTRQFQNRSGTSCPCPPKN